MRGLKKKIKFLVPVNRLYGKKTPNLGIAHAYPHDQMKSQYVHAQLSKRLLRWLSWLTFSYLKHSGINYEEQLDMTNEQPARYEQNFRDEFFPENFTVMNDFGHCKTYTV